MTGLTYKDSGVDIAAADSFVSRVATLCNSTRGSAGAQVVPGTASYAGLLRPDFASLGDAAKPLLAASCDGVGTKLLVARMAGIYGHLGQDLVAMNVNDLLPSVARPQFFLNYIATGALDEEAMIEVCAGMASACKLAGCVLLGGETAEMPGVYAPGDFDLAGFAVGLADEANLPDPNDIEAGDVILGLPASGVHSNGFSLVRRALFEVAGLSIDAEIAELGAPLGEVLLRPTPIYVPEVLAAAQIGLFKAAAHITGGGLLGRCSKLLPKDRRDDLAVSIDSTTYERPPVFDLIATSGGVTTDEMAKTFNMGLGFVIVVAEHIAARMLSDQAPAQGWLRVGQVVSRAAGAPAVELGFARV